MNTIDGDTDGSVSGDIFCYKIKSWKTDWFSDIINERGQIFFYWNKLGIIHDKNLKSKFISFFYFPNNIIMENSWSKYFIPTLKVKYRADKILIGINNDIKIPFAGYEYF